MPEEQQPRETQENAEPSPQDAPPDDPAALKKALEEQTQKAEQYLANWQRAGADLANYKKRADQEKQELNAFANGMLISSLLPILDDLERALENVDAKLAGLTWVDGIKLIYRKLQATLESQGLTQIRTVGERFDPTMHEAVMQVEGDEGMVVSELQKGYRLRERVLRPAMVGVGKGRSPEPESGETGDAPNG